MLSYKFHEVSGYLPCVSTVPEHIAVTQDIFVKEMNEWKIVSETTSGDM